MNKTLRGVAWALWAGVAGCAETVHVVADAGAPDAPAAGDGPIDPATFLARQRELLCTQLIRCPAVSLPWGPDDVAICVAHHRRYADPGDRQRIELVGAGHIRFDAAAARRCLATMARYCPTQAFLWESCHSVFEGAVAEGAPCEMYNECAAGLYCNHGDPGAFVCPGRCVTASAAPGAQPDSQAACRVDPGAIAYTLRGSCFSVRAAPPAGLGEPCDWIDEGAGRVRVALCTEGLACSAHLSGTAGRCVRPLAGGAACAVGDVCVVGFLCNLRSSDVGRCEPYGISRLPGGPCTPRAAPGGAPPTCDPLRQLECGDDGRCVRVGDGTEGSRCVPGVDTDGLCDEGLFCDRGGGVPTCRRRRAVGAACSEGLMCQTGTCRDGTCAARLCN